MDVLSRALESHLTDTFPESFHLLNAKQYEDFKKALEAELVALQKGTSSTYLQFRAELEQKRDEELRIAQHWKNYLAKSAQKEYETEVRAAEDEYESHKTCLKNKVLEHLHEKKRAIQEENELFDIGNESSLLTHDTPAAHYIDRRKLRHRRAPANAQPLTPTLNFFDDYLLFPTDQTAEIPVAVTESIQRALDSGKMSSLDNALFSPLLSTANHYITTPRERDPRASERAERDREKAVERGLTAASEADVQADLQTIETEIQRKRMKV
ncbi:Clr6 histone deacetylase complex subunit Sds3 [Schizosaccharomyces japonicus yFS275]|uniref:Clr6 histone deacetylase complex subunit Sds3 n=1 Tax=Schizosaccharomyces japonicus (strain yFS275 / FY16936) TaxID=402676 RepID=B6K302_SCHJY|nr:Clr6 histone deacetylase complex subunit Sds3 [Schizosaccharomyces japonicus yFS275]EEB07859.1 Clr6 histone deacetylase complex subunit Sds3 [Schizosaccharomyces japonicus yFS275]